MNTRILILVMSVGLTGCASLDRESCLSADWQLIGFNDGVAGRKASRLEKHRDACSDYGVVPQMDQYLSGYDRGVRRYCTAENGYRTGRAGKELNSVCSGNLRPEFTRGFELGIEAHKQVVQLNNVRHELKTLRSDQRSDVRDLNDKREQLIAEGISSDTRVFLLQEIDELSDEIRKRKTQIKRQQHAVQMERRYLRNLETDLRKQL